MAMRPSNAVSYLKPPTERLRRSSIGSTNESAFEEVRQRSSSSFSGLLSPTNFPHADVYDPSPLDVRQLFRLRASWKVVQRHMEDVGVDLFVAFFRSQPAALESYRLWNTVCSQASETLHYSGEKKFDALRFDDDFKAQTRKYLQYLDDIVQRFDTPDARNNAIRSLTCYHRRLCQSPADIILKLDQPFLEAMKRALEDRYNNQLEAIYTEFIHHVVTETHQKLTSSSSRNSSIDTLRIESPSHLNHYLRSRRRSGTPNLQLHLPRIDD